MIFLGGGGSEHDEALLWNELFEPGQRIVVWPFAEPGPARRRAVGEWFVSALARRGDFAIDVWLSGTSHASLEAEVLVIPGGNTFALLAYLRRHDLWPVDFGGRIYGGSAGAIVLGADIAIAGGMDSNDAGLADTRGLDLLGGCVVHPHYGPEYAAAAREWARTNEVTVLGIPERAGVVVDGNRARNSGPATVHVFTADSWVAYRPGETWRLVS
jgi:dipeptidase E